MSISVINKYIKAIRFRFCQCENLALRTKVQQEIVKKEKFAIDPNKLAEIIEGTLISPRMNLLVLMLYETAARIAEIANLEYSDISPGENGSGIVSISPIKRASKKRVAKINKETYQKYEIYSKVGNRSDPRIFKSTVGALKKEWRTFCLRNNIEYYSPHWFRHSKCSQMLNNETMELPFVQYYMGHKSLASTSKYAHSDNRGILHNYTTDHLAESPMTKKSRTVVGREDLLDRSPQKRINIIPKRNGGKEEVKDGEERKIEKNKKRLQSKRRGSKTPVGKRRIWEKTSTHTRRRTAEVVVHPEVEDGGTGATGPAPTTKSATFSNQKQITFGALPNWNTLHKLFHKRQTSAQINSQAPPGGNSASSIPTRFDSKCKYS